MFKCECGKEFETYRQFNGHKSVHRSGGRYSVSRAQPKNNIKHFCLYCNKEFNHSHSTKNKYCSLACQKKFQTNELIRVWLETGTFKNKNTPGWVKNTLKELRGEKCQECNISEWNNKPLDLECDHVDGNSENNHIDNLRLICPNCHSQTPSFKGKNRGNGRKHRYKNKV